MAIVPLALCPYRIKGTIVLYVLCPRGVKHDLLLQGVKMIHSMFPCVLDLRHWPWACTTTVLTERGNLLVCNPKARFVCAYGIALARLFVCWLVA